jgi:hypothetical protein
MAAIPIIAIRMRFQVLCRTPTLDITLTAVFIKRAYELCKRLKYIKLCGLCLESRRRPHVRDAGQNITDVCQSSSVRYGRTSGAADRDLWGALILLCQKGETRIRVRFRVKRSSQALESAFHANLVPRPFYALHTRASPRLDLDLGPPEYSSRNG